MNKTYSRGFLKEEICLLHLAQVITENYNSLLELFEALKFNKWHEDKSNDMLLRSKLRSLKALHTQFENLIKSIESHVYNKYHIEYLKGLDSAILGHIEHCKRDYNKYASKQLAREIKKIEKYLNREAN